MGFEDEVEQSLPRRCRETNGRSKQTCELTSSVIPRGTPFHRLVELELPAMAFDLLFSLPALVDPLPRTVCTYRCNSNVQKRDRRELVDVADDQERGLLRAPASAGIYSSALRSSSSVRS
jgi:hypothetical protein